VDLLLQPPVTPVRPEVVHEVQYEQARKQHLTELEALDVKKTLLKGFLGIGIEDLHMLLESPKQHWLEQAV
jgi:hypothetical protein